MATSKGLIVVKGTVNINHKCKFTTIHNLLQALSSCKKAEAHHTDYYYPYCGITIFKKAKAQKSLKPPTTRTLTILYEQQTVSSIYYLTKPAHQFYVLNIAFCQKIRDPYTIFGKQCLFTLCSGGVYQAGRYSCVHPRHFLDLDPNLLPIASYIAFLFLCPSQKAVS